MIKDDLTNSSMNSTHKDGKSFWYDRKFHKVENAIFISIDEFVEFVYSIDDDIVYVQDITDRTDQNYVLSVRDNNFLEVLQTNIDKLNNSIININNKDNKRISETLYFNYANLIIVKYPEYNKERFILHSYTNDFPTIIVTCRNDTEVNEILNGLKLLLDAIKEKYIIVVKDRINKFNEERDYGVKLNDSFISKDDCYIFNINSNTLGKVITYDDIKKYSPLQEFKALPFIKRHIDKLDLFFPDKLVPIEHEEIYDNYNKFYDDENNKDKEYIVTEDDKFFILYDEPMSYAYFCKDVLEDIIKDYILPLTICKRYNINKVFDIGCNTGIQSWYFNQNNIHYIGIEEFPLNVFPFRRNSKYIVSYYNGSWPKIYRKNNNFGFIKESYKDSLAILFDSVNLLKDDNTLDEVYIRTLINHHNYVLATIDCMNENIITNSKTIKDNCKDPIIFKSNEACRYILLIKR